MMTVAYFVTPHGFGHAARACAVMNALHRRLPSLRFHIFTTVPRWFFSESLTDCFEYHECESDIGLVQISPLEENLTATAERLERAPWRNPDVIESLARRLHFLNCGLVVADISPLGLRAACRAHLPSVLVENFTWDWIYRGYDPSHPRLLEHGRTMAGFFRGSDLHIQTEPWCRKAAGGKGVAPVARRSLTPPPVTRSRLGVSDGDPLVLLTMGGVRWNYRALATLENHPRAHFVVPGGADRADRRGRLTVLPFRSGFHHPDLVAASDVVVGKLGYSTVAEAHQSGAAMAYIARPRFPESGVLAEFVQRTMFSMEITEEGFNDGSWVEPLDELLRRPRRRPPATDGAGQAARLILDRFDGELG